MTSRDFAETLFAMAHTRTRSCVCPYKVFVYLSLLLKFCLEDSLSFLLVISKLQAEACKSVEYGMKKCPNGMYSEIKYDGERVQVHKKGDEFKYFSRSLKPVLPHKVSGRMGDKSST